MKQRVSRETWETEILCKRPRLDRCVFNHFDPQIHIRETSIVMQAGPNDRQLTLAIDFGYSAPFVCLWVFSTDSAVHVMDEYLQPQRTVQEHLSEIGHRPWPRADSIACDPAGAGRNEQTSTSNVSLLREAGYRVHTRKSFIAEGLELIRADLRAADGRVRLFIHPRCEKLIAALQLYHYAPQGSELPVKDGTTDHPIDALRYFYVNRRATTPTLGRCY